MNSTGYPTLFAHGGQANPQAGDNGIAVVMGVAYFAILLFLLGFALKIRRQMREAKPYAENDFPGIDPLPEDRLREVLRPGERLLWIGAPHPRRFRSMAIAAFIFGLIPFSLGSAFLGVLILHPPDNLKAVPAILIGGTAGTAFTLIGITLVLSPWKIGSRLREVVYAITDRRGIVITAAGQLWNPVPAEGWGQTLIEFTPDELRGCRRKRADLGRIDLIFRKVRVETSKSRTTHWYGFLGLEYPEEAERAIAEAFPKSIDKMP